MPHVTIEKHDPGTSAPEWREQALDFHASSVSRGKLPRMGRASEGIRALTLARFAGLRRNERAKSAWNSRCTVPGPDSVEESKESRRS